MIPKVIHYCWFGGNPLPESTKRYIESWKKFCPDYEIKEWNESNFDINCNAYIAEAYKAKRWAFVSDVARTWILVNHGGVYFDTDVEVIKPIDDLLEYDAFTAFESKFQIGMGILGCVKGHPMFAALLEEYGKARFKQPDGTYDTSVIGRRFKEICLRYGFEPDNTLQTVNGLTILPKEYFYPSDPITKEFKITENTRTIHYYDASWVSPVDIYGRTQQGKFKFIPARFRPGFTRMVGILKYEGLWSLMRKLMSTEFARFVMVGILATAIHYGIYLLFNLIMPANPAYAIGYILSFLCNFFLSSHFTFRKKATFRKGVGFGLSHAVNFAMHMLLLNLFLFLGLGETLAPIPVYCICIPVNFLLVRFVFNKL